MDKNQKQALKNQYKTAQKQKLLDEMPISPQEFYDLFLKLTQCCEEKGCDHTLKNTIAILGEDRDLEPIVDWLNEHGGFCDCEVILNVASDYDFALQENN